MTIPDLAVPEPARPAAPVHQPATCSHEIEQFVSERVSCFATTARRATRSSRRCASICACGSVDGVDETFHVNKLKQEITEFLSPWAFRGDARPTFNGKVYKSVLVNFIEERPYVDYVSDVHLFHGSPAPPPTALTWRRWSARARSRSSCPRRRASTASTRSIRDADRRSPSTARARRRSPDGARPRSCDRRPAERRRRTSTGCAARASATSSKAGSANWTDYNTHDPGISILEALAYAITELAYRTGFPIEDILASAARRLAPTDPYPDQTFYSARKILTVNPTTAEDFRRLLIDVDTVRNAWVRCKACACDAPFFAWCEDGELVLSHDPSRRSDPGLGRSRRAARPVRRAARARGRPELRRPERPQDRPAARRDDADGRRHSLTIEVRFPAWGLARRDERRRARRTTNSPFTLTVAGPNRTTTGTTPVDDAELRNHWFDVFYVDYEIALADGTKIAIENASVRLFGDGTVRRQATVAELLRLARGRHPGGVRRSRTAGSCPSPTRPSTPPRRVLETHRNLDEDYCQVELVEIDEIAVCADVEVEPTADIDLVQARIWYEIERYLDPPVEFWSLDELLAGGEPVEAIFDGPELANGFLTERGPQRHRPAGRAARVGHPQPADRHRRRDQRRQPAADRLRRRRQPDRRGSPTRTGARGTSDFDPDRISASWLLYLPADHRPRLHHGLSRFLFSSNGLPFLPRLDEAEDTPRAAPRAGRPPEAPRAPSSTCRCRSAATRQLEAYYPVQHSFPLTYGIGPAGLPSTATAAAAGPGQAAEGLPDGVRAAAAQRLRPGRARRRPVLARPDHSTTRTSRACSTPPRSPATTRSSTPALTEAALRPAARVASRVPRAPQPVPRPPAGPVRRELRRVRDARSPTSKARARPART